jgi:CheY-like chemotaxis protein
MSRPPLALVVDDDPDVRGMLALALRRLGFEVLAAGGGEEALRLYRGRRADVVLCDVVMPGMDGPAALEALQAHDPGVRCVFMSGHSAGHTAGRLLELGAAGVVEKPFRDLPRLAGLLREAAGGQP